ALQELGGWESPEMVPRYAHLSAEHLAPHAERLCSLRAVESPDCGKPFALPERRVTLHSGHMGNTSAFCGSAKCLGRSVTRWMNGCGLWPGCSTGRRWRCCAGSSMSRARPATRSSSAIRIVGSKG